MNHPSQNDLFEYADAVLAPARSAEIAAHLAGCGRCRNAAAAIRTMAVALRALPVEAPSPAFTRKLLNRIGLREANPLWWMFLKNLAPVLSAGVVSAVIITVSSATSGGTQPSAGKSLFDGGPIAGSIRGGLEAFTAWTGATAARYLTFSIGADATSQLLMLGLFLGGIGLLDHFLLGPMLRRRP